MAVTTQDNLPQKLRQELEPIANKSGLTILDIALKKAGKYTRLVVTVDLEDGPGGVDSDQIGDISRLLGARIDELDPISGEYVLEIGTPGAERELRTDRDFRRALTRNVEIVLEDEKLSGKLVEVNDGKIMVETAGQPHTIEKQSIIGARTVIVMARGH
ncbi:MAG: hypothetical protein Q4A71_01945 [Actinomycetaceae bacterium]|nr:hypothetical protein [Actinomycetaceae bacterium]